ncbi:MAG: DUF4258 domain-containing protein [Pseudomonadota bacterium]
MHSERFQKSIRLTDHARIRMHERGVNENTLLDLVESGQIKRKDERHLWIFKHYPERHDNMLCVAAIEGQALIILTIMNHWQEQTP